MIQRSNDGGYRILSLSYGKDSISDGHTVHDFDKRFELEDDGQIDTTKRFLWKMIEQ